jgi:hypothetical protein
MKLIRFGEAGGERPGVLLDDGSRLYVSDFVPDYDETFFARGGMEALRGWLKTHISLASRPVHNPSGAADLSSQQDRLRRAQLP